MARVPVFDGEAVLAAVSPGAAIERTRTAFERHAAGDWVMPAKVYVDAPGHGDFRAMPARGEGLATLKWVTSFPGNPARGLPVVAGALLVSSTETGELLAVIDCAAITSLRTGAAAAVSAQALAAPDAETVGLIGCGVNGAWAARCLAAAGYGPGVLFDPRPDAAAALAVETRLERRRARRRRRAGRRRHRHPGGDAGDRGRRPAPGPAPRGARRRRGGQGRGRARGAGALLAVLRRVGAGVQGRRALRGGRRRGDRPRAGDRDRRRSARARARSPIAGRDHPVRLHRARDAGPRDRAGGARIRRARATRRRSSSRWRASRAAGSATRRGRPRRRPCSSSGSPACRPSSGSSRAPCGG